MNRYFVPCLLFAITACVQSVHADTPKTKDDEAQRVQHLDGVWVLEAVEQVGVKLKGDQLPVRLRGMIRTIDGKRMTVASSGREYECEFIVDNKATPKRIDITVKRNARAPQVLKGIYQIEDDILRIAEDARTRPTSFNTHKDTRAIVYTFTRHKD